MYPSPPNVLLSVFRMYININVSNLTFFNQSFKRLSKVELKNSSLVSLICAIRVVGQPVVLFIDYPSQFNVMSLFSP